MYNAYNDDNEIEASEGTSKDNPVDVAEDKNDIFEKARKSETESRKITELELSPKDERKALIDAAIERERGEREKEKRDDVASSGGPTVKDRTVGDILSQYMVAPYDGIEHGPGVIDNIIIGMGFGWIGSGGCELALRKFSRQLKQKFITDDDEMDDEVIDYINSKPLEDRSGYMWMRDRSDIDLVNRPLEAENTQRMLDANMGIFGHVARIAGELSSPFVWGGIRAVESLARGGINLARNIVGSNIASNVMSSVILNAAKGSRLSGATLEFVGQTSKFARSASKFMNESAGGSAMKGAAVMATFAVATHEGREYIHLPVDDLGSEIILQSVIGAALGGGFKMASNALAARHAKVRNELIQEYKNKIINPESLDFSGSLIDQGESKMSDRMQQKLLEWTRIFPLHRGLASKNPIVRTITSDFFQHQYVDRTDGRVSVPLMAELNMHKGLGVDIETEVEYHYNLYERGGDGTREDFDRACTLMLHGKQSLAPPNPHVNGAVTAIKARKHIIDDLAIDRGVFRFKSPIEETFIHVDELLEDVPYYSVTDIEGNNFIYDRTIRDFSNVKARSLLEGFGKYNENEIKEAVSELASAVVGEYTRRTASNIKNLNYEMKKISGYIESAINNYNADNVAAVTLSIKEYNNFAKKIYKMLNNGDKSELKMAESKFTHDKMLSDIELIESNLNGLSKLTIGDRKRLNRIAKELDEKININIKIAEKYDEYTNKKLLEDEIFSVRPINKNIKIPIIHGGLNRLTVNHLSSLMPDLTSRQIDNVFAQIKEHASRGHESWIPIVKNAASHFKITWNAEKILGDLEEARNAFVSAFMEDNTSLTEKGANKIFEEFATTLRLAEMKNDPTYYSAGRASSTIARALDVDPTRLVDWIDTDVVKNMHLYCCDMGYSVAERRILNIRGYKNFEELVDDADMAVTLDPKSDKQAEKDLRLLRDLPFICKGRKRPGEGSESPWIDKVVDVLQHLNVMRSLGNVALTAIEDMSLTAHKRGTLRYIADITNEILGAELQGMSRSELARFGVGIDYVSSSSRLLLSNDDVKSTLGKITGKFMRMTGLPRLDDARDRLLSGMIMWDLANDVLGGKLVTGVNTRLSAKSIDRVRAALEKHAEVPGFGDYEKFNLNMRHWDIDAQMEFMSENERILRSMSPRPIPGTVPNFLHSRYGRLLSVFQTYNAGLTCNVLIPLLMGGHYGQLVNLVVRGTGYAMVTNMIRGHLTNNQWDLEDPEFYRQSFLRSPLGVAENILNPISSVVLKGVHGDLKVMSGRDLAYDLLGSGTIKYALDVADALNASYKGATSDAPLSESQIRRIRYMLPLQNLHFINPILDYFTIPEIIKHTGGKPRKTRMETYQEKTLSNTGN